MIIENEQLTIEKVINFIEDGAEEYAAYGEDMDEYGYEYDEKKVLYFEGLADAYCHLLHVMQKLKVTK